MTCWGRLRGWNAAGVWEQLHQGMLTCLREHDHSRSRRFYAPFFHPFDVVLAEDGNQLPFEGRI